jgi:hypothetical protein
MAHVGRVDIAAQQLRLLVVDGIGAHGGTPAEAVDVGSRQLLEVRLPRHGTLHRHHLLADVWAEGDAVRTRGGVLSPERASLVRATVVVGHVCRTVLFDPCPRMGEQRTSCVQ